MKITKKYIIKFVLVSAFIFSLISMNVNASGIRPTPYKKVSNESGVFMRDQNCKKTYLLPKNSFVYSLKGSEAPIVCNVDGVNYTLNYAYVVGNKGYTAIGYTYTDVMVDGGADLDVYLNSSDPIFSFAKTTLATNVRDINCKKIGLINPNETVSIYKYSDDKTLCSINGEVYRMVNIEYKGKSAYVSTSNF